MLERIGPRRWIACLMLVWGCLSTAMLLVETARGFYLLRFLLGSPRPASSLVSWST